MDNFLIAKATDVGVARQFNEDSMTVFDSPNGQVLAVCDGMGGQAAGDVASQLAVSIIENILTDNIFGSPEEAISRSILAANQGVLNRSAQNPELEGMGSTCVMMIIKNGRVHCGWVGDSRIYYIANHTIRQISHDQSYVQQLVDSGQITKAEAANHPQRNEITNCIGLQGMSAPDTIAVPIVPEPGSVFLLCSDGLSCMVDEKQIEHVISNSKMSLQQKADRLVAMANEAGGLDNITVELVQFGTSEVTGATSGTLFETPVDAAKGKRKSRKMLYSIIGLFIVAGFGAAGGYLYMQKKEPNTETSNETGGSKAPTGTTTSSSSTTGSTSNSSTSTSTSSSTNTSSSSTSSSTGKTDAKKVLNNPGNPGKSGTTGKASNLIDAKNQLGEMDKRAEEERQKEKEKEAEELILLERDKLDK